MDKHKALIHSVMVALVNVERKALSLHSIDHVGHIHDRDRPYVEEAATAAVNAVYEALKEPSEEMLRAGYNADISPPEATYLAMLSASALSSPLGEE